MSIVFNVKQQKKKNHLKYLLPYAEKKVIKPKFKKKFFFLFFLFSRKSEQRKIAKLQNCKTAKKKC